MQKLRLGGLSFGGVKSLTFAHRHLNFCTVCTSTLYLLLDGKNRDGGYRNRKTVCFPALFWKQNKTEENRQAASRNRKKTVCFQPCSRNRKTYLPSRLLLLYQYLATGACYSICYSVLSLFVSRWNLAHPSGASARHKVAWLQRSDGGRQFRRC